MKFLLKYKKWILAILFVLPLLFSLYVQYDENINKYDYWNYQVLKELDLATQEEIKSLNTKDAIAKFKDDKKDAIVKFKDDKKEIIRKFLPTSEQYRNFGCYKKFNTNTDESMDIIINSLGVYQFGRINDECFTNQSKQILFVSYLFVYFAIFFTIIILFTDKIRRLIHYKNHSGVIGLNNNSRELISKLIAEKENIKIYENDNTNKYINELENIGEMIISGKLEYTIESNNCDIINTKEIYIINNSDTESLSNLSLLLNKFNNSKNRKIKDKTKIYIAIKNRENKALFDKKGIYNELITDYYEIYPFSINEIIVQEMFKDRSLVSNIKKIESGYVENLKILIVGFNDLSEEILYNILKLGHFDLNKITEVTVIDDNYELLNSKYKTIIKRGKEPYENSNESLWKLEFLPYKCLYEDRGYNRIILCDKELNNGIDIFNYINNNFHVVLEQNNTIIQIFNEHKNINYTINIDNNNFKNFYTFGDIETTVTLDNIKNNNLYKVAEYTNDFKEIDESKKWRNIDSFTRESNITEKLHMNIKLDAFDSHLTNSSNTESETKKDFKTYYEKNKKRLEYITKKLYMNIKDIFNLNVANSSEKDQKYIKLLKDYYEKNKNNLEKYLNEAIKLPYSIEILSELYDYYLEKNFDEYKKIKIKMFNLKSEIKKLEENLKESKKSELEELKKQLKNFQINNKDSLKDKNFYNEVKEKLVFGSDKSSSDNMEVMMVISLINFYLKIKDKPNFMDIIHKLAQIEHTRWNAYHILNGWTRKKEKEKDRKDMNKKEHFDLCDWETLKNEDEDVIKYDYKNIYQISFVAYCLGWEIVEIKEENKDNLKIREI